MADNYRDGEECVFLMVIGAVLFACLIGVAGCMTKEIIAEIKAPVEVENARSTEQQED
jgi:hypothetical protein